MGTRSYGSLDYWTVIATLSSRKVGVKLDFVLANPSFLFYSRQSELMDNVDGASALGAPQGEDIRAACSLLFSLL